jgi:ribosomal protein S27E
MDFMDGNMLAGTLREIFTMDVTAAEGRCAGCGRVGMVAEARVYDHAAGLVARCPGCDAVLMRVVRAPDRTYLDMHGMSFLELHMPSA